MNRRNAFLWLAGLLVLVSGITPVPAQDQATLVVHALGDMGKRSDAPVKVYAPDSKVPVVSTTVGKPVDLTPGTYRIELEVLGGTITRPEVITKAGRQSTIIINEVAGLEINALDREGKDLGLGVEVYDGVSGKKLGATLSGEMLFAYPGVVDIKVATPPQAQWWRQVELRSGGIQHLQIRERVQGQLLVKPLLNGRDVSPKTGVVVYYQGTQKEAARSEPGREHRFMLDAGLYDIFIANQTGQGQPFVVSQAEVEGEHIVEKDVFLDGQGEHAESDEEEERGEVSTDSPQPQKL